MEDIFLEEIDDSKKDEYLKYHEFKDNDEKLIFNRISYVISKS